MSDNPMDKLPAHNRVSIRAVLVHEGDDASAALAEAGFAEAVAIPVVLGEQPDPPGGILGDGITANMIAVLETEQEEDCDATSAAQPPVVRQPAAQSRPSTARPSGPVTATLPPAYGMQPLAPVRRNNG
jgi:hypothetical protein